MARLREGRKIVGVSGQAMQVLFEREPTDKPDIAGTVAMWFVECPNQSPAWRHYHVALIHLRPIEGVKPAYIRRPGATHEIVIAALDPSKWPTANNAESWSFLTPLNLEEQIKMPDDATAEHLLEHAIEQMIAGHLWAEPPLSHQVEPWRSWLRAHEDIKPVTKN